MHGQQLHIEGKQSHDVKTREQEMENFTTLFHDICPRFTQGIVEVRRSCSGLSRRLANPEHQVLAHKRFYRDGSEQREGEV
jgi:hypothetical protein